MKDQISPEGKQFSSADFADSSIEEGTLLVTAADDRKRRRKLLILLILTLLCILVGVGFYLSRTMSFYNRTIRSLNFDYRQREEVTADPAAETGAKGLALAGSVGGTVQVRAVEMWFDASEVLADSVSEMDYTYSGSGEELSVRSGGKNGLRTQKQTLRRTGGKSESEQDDGWVQVSDSELPCLYDFFFAAGDHDQSIIWCDSSYHSVVGDTAYTCEIWLLETKMNGQTEYFTLYRYYGADNKLAAVRVLQSETNMMAVYDIKDYSLS